MGTDGINQLVTQGLITAAEASTAFAYDSSTGVLAPSCLAYPSCAVMSYLYLVLTQSCLIYHPGLALDVAGGSTHWHEGRGKWISIFGARSINPSGKTKESMLGELWCLLRRLNVSFWVLILPVSLGLVVA